ncbi:hypothetical protein [Pandoraea terrigena]|uniref:NmrA family transcriptional regulator n=1 Tax=Pandoraea terrigena TaxID=2508292 RepID=A0A5E4WQR5_9BURK|nr:hypothetical protein [Pandoraea terrigena]VVE26030.1 NmrA family transcriptional regulator [Pandoraea terrigena]
MELEGPYPVSPRDIAASLSRLLGREVVANAVARDTWETLFRAQGMSNPLPRMQMIDGFNEGWLCFEGGAVERRLGNVTLDIALHGLIEQAS